MRRSSRSFALGVAVALCLCSLANLGPTAPVQVLGAEQLTVVQPTLFTSTNGVVYQRPSLFGLPNFAEKISGQVIYPESTTNPYGCQAYASFIPDDPDDGGSVDPPPLIALIDRGGNCSFVVKVQHAQDAGAQAVLIVNNDATYGRNLPYMSGGVEGISVKIPAMIVRGSDGDIIKANLNATGGLYIAMSYFLPNPDDRVEFDLYTVAGETASAKFRTQFRSVVTALGSSVLFEPHYQYLKSYYTSTGRTSSCSLPFWQSCTTANLNARCGNRCINCGRYCQNDQDGNLTAGATGGDVVLEQLRAKCVWQYGNDTQPASNTYWFDYNAKHAAACANAPHQFDATCGNALIAELGIPASYITTCMGTTGYTSSNMVAIAERDLTFTSTFSPLPPPDLFVNQQPYHGDLTCPDPINVNCAPLQMICSGFQTGTAPAACSTSIGCELGVMFDACDVCGGDNSTCTGCDGVVKSGMLLDACGVCLLRTDSAFATDSDKCSTSSSKSFPVGAVIGIIIAAVVVIGGGVYLYMRRQNAAIKDDIDSLLKQYLPLDGPVSGEERPRVTRLDATRLINEEGESDQM